MSEEPVNQEALVAPEVNEREVLMSRARLLGIEFSNNIGTETLRERVRSKFESLEDDNNDDDQNQNETNGLTGETTEVVANKPKQSIQQQIYDEQMRLVRLRISCMDPKKKDLPGEIFTVANEYLGTVRKFVPFGEVTEDGFHVPFCIYTMMDERKFLNIRTTRDRRTGQIKIENQYVKEFSLEILPQLTQDELDRLANAQAAAGSID